MDYCESIKLKETDLSKAKENVTAELKKHGFGVLTEIDVKETFKKKLDVDFMNYVILGACNPNYAHQALEMESDLGVFLPCNVVIKQEQNDGPITVTAVNPVASMMSVVNRELSAVAETIRMKLNSVLEGLRDNQMVHSN